MHFLDASADQPLQQTLLSCGLLRPDLWESWVKPSDGNLSDLLMMNAADLDNTAWIGWLIEEHNFWRIQSPRKTREAPDINVLPPDLQAACFQRGVIPLMKNKSGVMLGAHRPDVIKLLPGLTDFWGCGRIHLFALSPLETATLRAR